MMRSLRAKEGKPTATTLLEDPDKLLALYDLIEDLKAKERQESRVPFGWDVSEVFDRLQKRLDRRFAAICGFKRAGVTYDDARELLDAALKLARLCGIELGVSAEPRPVPETWTSDPAHFVPVTDHAVSYIGAGLRPPVRYKARPGIRLADDGSLITKR